jgi:hypothetical protein
VWNRVARKSDPNPSTPALQRIRNLERENEQLRRRRLGFFIEMPSGFPGERAGLATVRASTRRHGPTPTPRGLLYSEAGGLSRKPADSATSRPSL